MGEFSQALTLVKPHLTGQKVRDAQWLLSGHNVFSDTELPIHPYTGRIDGEYGPVSYSATREAKRLAGYPAGTINGNFGQVLYNILLAKTELPDEYRARRAAIIKTNAEPIKLKALELALSQVGYKESPFRSNCTKYGSWYGMNCVPWCAIFISWCISQNGRRWKHSYVPEIVDSARYGRDGMSITYSPEPGDLIAYNLHGERDAHVEFFQHWNNSSSFAAVGGNTGPTDMSNGGEVDTSTRYTFQVDHFIKLHF